MATSMDDILSEPTEPQTPNAEPVITPEPEKQEVVADRVRQEHRKAEWTAQGRDPETGQFLPKEEKAEPEKEVKPEVKEEPKQELSEKEKGILAGLEAERRKRQDVERELAELRTRLQAQPQQPQQPQKTFYDDPDAALAQQEQRFQFGMLQTRAQTSEMIARSQHQDYDQVFEVFKEVVKTTPGLVERMFADPHPAEFAYKVGKNYKAIQEAGSVDNMRAQIEKEVRLKLEQEYKDKEAQLLKERAAIPGSLSDARGSVQTKPVFTGPTPMSAILGR